MILKKSQVSPLAFAILTTLASGASFAAQQGTLGAISEGNVEVRVTKEAAVRISKLDDIDFGVHNVMVGDWFMSDQFCVFSSSGTYAVAMASSNSGLGANGFTTGGGYTMTNGSNALPYEVFYGAENVPAEVEIGGQLGDQVDENCVNGTNAEITVKIASADFNIVAPGSYSDTLNIFVRPE